MELRSLDSRGSNKNREQNDDINADSAINIDDGDDNNEGMATQNLKISGSF